MQLGDIPLYLVKDIEQRARQFLREHLGDQVEIPIDVDLLLETIDGVDLDYFPSLRGSYRTEGMVARDTTSGLLVIYVDEELADRHRQRYRMTVAEELSHVILHRSVIEKISSIEAFKELQGHRSWYNLERNAKRLAAAILMPADKVIKAAEELYPRLVKVAGFDNPEAVKKQLAINLAKNFEVSTQAMTYRLNEWPVRVYDRADEAMKNELDYLP
ncbi:MAG: ImmA/IrrE family metallo-endopeptidase [Planctomycetota bacterium]